MPEKPTYEELEQRIKELEQALNITETKTKNLEPAFSTGDPFFQNLFENAAFGIVVCRLIKDEEGKPIDFEHLQVNAATKRHTGFDPKMIIGKRALEIAEQEDIASIIEIYGQVVAEGKNYEYEQHFAIYDRHLQVGAFPLENDLFALTFIDITERKGAEKKLKEQNYYLERAQDLGKIGTWELDLINNVLVWTDENCRIFGVPEGSVVDYKIFLSKVHPDDREYVDKEWKAGIEGKPYDIEHRLLIDGEVKWVREKADVEFDDNGKAVSAIGFTQDITEHKMIEEALYGSNKTLTEAQRVAKIGSWWYDPVTKISTWTDEMFHIFGLEPKTEAPPDEYHRKIIHPDDRDRFDSAVSRAATDGVGYDLELRITLPNGEIRHVNTKCGAKKDDRGIVKGLVGTTQDITEKKRNEERFREANLKQQEAIRAGNVGLWDWDLETNRVHYSKEWKQQIGYEDHEISDDFEEWRSRVHPDDLEQALDKVQQSIARASDDHKAEFRFRHRDGSYHWILTQASIIKDDDGNPIRMLGSHIDITDRKETESELRKRENLLQRIFEILPVGLWITDRNGNLIKGNPAGVRIWGAEPHVGPENYGVFKARRLPSMEEIDPDDWALAHTIRKGVTITDELLEIDAFDGTKRTILNYTAPVKGINDNVEAAVIVNLDISDRVKAEQDAIRSEALLQTLINTIPDLIWLKNKEGVYLSCNPTFELFFGATESEIVGKTDYDFVDKELADFFREHDRKAEKIGSASKNEEWLTFKANGYQGLFETIKSPMRDTDGNLVGVLGIARDITHRKRTEDELKKNEQRYKSAQRIGRVGNWEYDILTETFWGSDQAKEIYGFEPESEQFTNKEIENCIPDRERVHQSLVDLIEKDTPYNLEFDIHPVSGPETRTIRSIAEILRDESGTPSKVIGVIHDVTDQVSALREKERLEAKLLQAQKMEAIGNLAGGIAHDFNNILSSVIGFTELALDETQKGTAVEDSLQEVYSAGKRAKDLVKQILAFARQSDEKIGPIQPSAIAKEVLRFIRSTIPTTIEIQQEIESESFILGNATQVHQILMNLSTNAAHAMENSGGILNVKLKDVVLDKKDLLVGMRPGNFVEIKLTDTGVGISPEIIESIFEPYFTTKGLGEGTGMGLAMVHGVVESYGGKISVESQLGKGTKFTIYLPITKKRSDQDAYVPERLPTGRERILFVDDEAPIAKMGSQILERLGYSVTTRTSSTEALELFRANPNDFDLVVTDMTMPNITGDVLTVELMKIRQDIPVILCTGYSKNISDETALEIGIKAFAYKPVVKADLSKTVRKVLDEAKGSAQA